MSYILDALKKSERERALVRGVGFADAARRVVQRTDWLPWLISGVALFALVVALLVFLLRDRLAPPQAALVAPVAETPPAAVEPLSKVEFQVAAVQAPATQAAEVKLAEQAPTAPALEEASVEPPPPVQAVEAPAKFLTDMPPEFQQIVPAMAVNIHVYAQDETQRILYINNQQYYRGDEVLGGATVEEIVPEGVVLRFHGQRFKLPRPS